MATTTSNSLASLACYLPPDRAHSRDSPSFAYVSSSSRCRSRRSCVSLAQPSSCVLPTYTEYTRGVVQWCMRKIECSSAVRGTRLKVHDRHQISVLYSLSGARSGSPQLFWFVGWAYFRVINNLQREWGVGVFSRG